MCPNKIVPFCLLVLLIISMICNISLLNQLNNSIEIRNKLIDYLAEKLEFSYSMFESEGEFEIFENLGGLK